LNGIAWEDKADIISLLPSSDPVSIAGSNISNSPAVGYFGIAFVLTGFIILFVWIDATIRVARRSDPLHRNTIHWTAIRYLVLIGVAFSIFFSIVPPPNHQPARFQ
jgi:uncharacterized BrkB/YihY/UPF0761 family membrane protein